MNKTNLVQGSKEWLETRKRFITASDISIINGTNRWKSEYILWLEKRSIKEPDKPNAAMEYGKCMEMPARELYMANTEIYVSPTIAYSKEWKYGMASLDGITEEWDVILEVKCPFSSKLYENALQRKVPDYYNDQMQWQLFVTKAIRCDYFVYVSELEHMLIEVFPDIPYQEELLAKAKVFMDRILENKKPEMILSDYKFLAKIIKKSESIDWNEFTKKYDVQESEIAKYVKLA
jgi:putative phage-type endonuclease